MSANSWTLFARQPWPTSSSTGAGPLPRLAPSPRRAAPWRILPTGWPPNIRATWFVAAGLVGINGMPCAAQTQQPQLAALTAPAERLPSGCRLEPVNPNAARANRFVMFPGVYENPWMRSGAEAWGAVSGIRWVVDGLGMPTYGLDPGPARDARLAEDVVESYRARYVVPTGHRVDVYAVRYKDPSLTMAALMAPLNTTRPGRPRIVIGATAVLVLLSAEGAQAPFFEDVGRECARAVSAHIESLKGRAF